jgi:hypothetical protein
VTSLSEEQVEEVDDEADPARDDDHERRDELAFHHTAVGRFDPAGGWTAQASVSFPRRTEMSTGPLVTASIDDPARRHASPGRPWASTAPGCSGRRSRHRHGRSSRPRPDGHPSSSASFEAAARCHVARCSVVQSGSSVMYSRCERRWVVSAPLRSRARSARVKSQSNGLASCSQRPWGRGCGRRGRRARGSPRAR